MIEMKTENKTIYKKSKIDHGSVMDEIQNRLDIFLLDCSEEIESFFHSFEITIPENEDRILGRLRLTVEFIGEQNDKIDDSCEEENSI